MLSSKQKKITVLIISSIVPAMFLIFQTEQAHAARWITPIYQVLSNTTSGAGAVVASIWGTTMTAVNSLVLALLIYVAFMNILRIQMDSYAVKKFLPTFIMAVILANFSFLIARIIIDIGNMAISLFATGDPSGAVTGAFTSIVGNAPSGPGDLPDGESSYIMYITKYNLIQIFVIASAVLVFVLSLIFLVRNYVLYFLVAIAPLAFMAMALPTTKKYFQQWWSNFFKWVFMPVVSVFWLWIAGQFLQTSNSVGDMFILPTAFAAFCLYMAITTPFKVGGPVLGAWGKLGKQAWGKTGGAAWNATGGAGIKAGKQWVGDKYSNVKRSATNYALDKNLAWSGSISRRARVGQLKQRVINSYFDDKNKQRNQEAFLAFLNSKEFKTPDKDGNVGFKKPVLAKLKGQARELFVDDEWNREVYAGRKNKQLFEQMPFVVANGRRIRRASLEDIADRSLTLGNRDGSVNDGYNNDRVKAAKESTAANKELQQRRRGARNVPDRGLNRTDPRYDPWEDENVDTLIDLENLPGDPRVMASGAVLASQQQAPGAPTSGTPASGGSTSSPILGPDGRPFRPAEGAGEPGESAQERDSELAGYMQELVSEFRNLEEQLGGQGSLGGEGGYDQLLGEISKMKPNLTLSDAGLAAAILPVMKVRIESMDPTALEQWGRKIRQVSEGVNKMTAGIEAENASVLRQIATVIRDGANPSKLAEGRQAIGEAANSDEDI